MLRPEGIGVKQCPSCNRVWMPDSTHPDGGVWAEEAERVDGADRDYCPDCLAERQAQVAGLSHDIEEIVERRHAEPAVAPPVYDSAAPASWGRPVLIAVILLVAIGAAVGVRTLYASRSKEVAGSGEATTGERFEATPAVGGYWSAPGPGGASEPRQPGPGQRPATGRAVRSSRSTGGSISFPEESVRGRTPERGSPSSASRSSEDRSRTTESSATPQTTTPDTASGSAEGSPPTAGTTTTTPGPTPPGDETPPDVEEGDEPPPVDIPPEFFIPPDIPPPDEFDEPPAPPPPDDIIIPAPPPE
jgi:hypothetical protein